jgi:hypothetical protein
MTATQSSVAAASAAPGELNYESGKPALIVTVNPLSDAVETSGRVVDEAVASQLGSPKSPPHLPDG